MAKPSGFNLELNSTPSAEVAGPEIEALQKLLDKLPAGGPAELLLVNPPLVPDEVFDLTTARRRGYYAFPPTGLLYLAAAAKKARPSLDIRILDLNLALLRAAQSDPFDYQIWKELLKKEIATCKAPVIGLTYMFGTTKPVYIEISNFIRENFPDVVLLSGGVQATYDFKELLENKLCDLVFRKEGEDQLNALLDSSHAGKPVSIPWGAAFSMNGQIFELNACDSENLPDFNLDVRPFYDLIGIKDYHLYGSLGAFSRFGGEESPFSTVLTNRGCRARCTFCTVRDFNGFGIRQREIESVIEEVKYLVREKGIKQIDWLDDDLLWNPKRAIELFKGLAAEVPELKWTASNGLIAVAIDEEILDWMVRSGMQAFKIGIETGNDEMLHLVKKPTTKQGLREKRLLFNKYPDVLSSPNFIIGFPNETFGQMMDTFNFADELQWDWSSFFICQPLKGTEMFSSFAALGDDRCEQETYGKTLNPGRSALKGEFKAKSGEGEVLTGRAIFDIPYDSVPNQEQLREIWFTFNFIVNFVNNVNYKPGGNPAKLVRWLEAIHSGYPHDASMAAALVRGNKLIGNKEQGEFYQKKFLAIVSESQYWQGRVADFPELLELAEVDLPIDCRPDSKKAAVKVSYNRDAIPEVMDVHTSSQEKYRFDKVIPTDTH